MAIENPERQRPVVEFERPTLAAMKIDKRKFRVLRPDQPLLSADVAQINQGGAIAGEQKVVAIIDGHAERGVMVGAAAATGERSRLVDHHLAAPQRREADCGGKAAEAGADNMNCPGHRFRRNCAIRFLKVSGAAGEWASVAR